MAAKRPVARRRRGRSLGGEDVGGCGEGTVVEADAGVDVETAVGGGRGADGGESRMGP